MHEAVPEQLVQYFLSSHINISKNLLLMVITV